MQNIATDVKITAALMETFSKRSTNGQSIQLLESRKYTDLITRPYKVVCRTST